MPRLCFRTQGIEQGNYIEAGFLWPRKFHRKFQTYKRPGRPANTMEGKDLEPF